jgi:hypothetical protein
MVEAAVEDQVMVEAVAAATVEAVAAATVEIPETIEEVEKKTEEMMVKIVTADAVDGNLTKLKDKNCNN